MPPKKYAVKGEPDFHNISDEKLKSFLDLIQQMIFSYSLYDEEKTKVLESVWKDLSNEKVERYVVSISESIDRDEGSPSSVLRISPKVRKSPAKRKI